jgi:ornithine cyclodeaminase/alanine dehydrogenase-like protein (mu-crystallin family)
MAIYLSDDDVSKLLSMEACIDVLDDLFKQDAQGLVENLPRQRIRLPKSTMTLMGGYALGSGAYLVRHSTANLLYNTDNGRLEAVLSPRDLAWIRTGAASGLATKYMARPDASVVGIIGTGRQAVTQLDGVCAVRPIKLIKAFSRNAENRERFSAEMRERLGVDVQAVDSPEAAVRGSDIVVTITNSRQPVFDGAWLEPGAHVNAAGANSPQRCEIDDTTIQRAAVVAVDNLEQAKIECGELITAVDRGVFRWRQAVELADVVGGKVSGRPSPEAITLFESQGLGIEDTAAAAYVLEQAKARGLGTPLPF